MVIHLGTLFGGLHHFAVSQTFMSTSMERDSRVRSSSPPPSPRQPALGLLASPETKRRDPPPSRRPNTPSTSVSRPPSASTAGIPSSAAQQTSPSLSASRSGRSRSRGRSRLRSTSKPKPKRARAPKTTARSWQNEKDHIIVRQLKDLFQVCVVYVSHPMFVRSTFQCY